CTPWNYKTGETKGRFLGRLEPAVGFSASVANKLGSYLSTFTEKATQGGLPITCKPYTLVTPNARDENFKTNCCDANGNGTVGTYLRETLQVNFQFGMNCEMPIGISTAAAVIFPPAGKVLKPIDTLLGYLGVQTMLRGQVDFIMAGGGSLIDPVQDPPLPPCVTPESSLNFSGTGQLQASAQIGNDTKKGVPGTTNRPIPPASSYGFKWPPWDNKHFFRLSLQGKGQVGGNYGFVTGWKLQPRPSVQVCGQFRARMADFVDLDKTACFPPWVLY
ncbi:MAG: hypothetical protein M3Z16_03210, partial [Pseudomonadota bacterium]|nr:hypothetical protein [Pseudomonadota bacterium]